MGFSSYCQICGMPLSHLCLVASPGEDGVYQIYRGGHNSDNTLRPPGLTHERHSWLTHVVALPTDEDSSLHQNCNVDDGDVLDHIGNFVTDIEDGKGDSHAGIHQACWKLAGQPSSLIVDGIQHIVETPLYQSIERKYHDQYFDFHSILEKPEKRWMIEDPMLSEQNKQQILALLLEGREFSIADKEEQYKDVPHQGEVSTARQPPKALVDLPEGMNQQTLYDWLGVTRSEMSEQPARLKAAWNRKRKCFHPNATGGGDPEALERVQWAYQVLSKPEWRQYYDDCDFEEVAKATEFANRVWYYVVRDSTA